MKFVILLSTALLFTGCASYSPTDVATLLAKNAVVAVAQHYGGDNAAKLASAGLSAAGEVLQGYVNNEPPLKVAAQSPGVKGVGQIVVAYLRDKGYVSQAVINQIHNAASIAAGATSSP